MFVRPHDERQNRWRGPTEETLLLASVALVGLVIAGLKAWSAPITTDEAMSFYVWVIRGPRFIWTDYTESNNHLLNTLAMWLVTRGAGESEIALRIPALLGNVVFLAGAVFLAGRLLVRPSLRLAFVGVVACHPYLVDFAALARGYALGSGFLFAGLATLCAALHGEATGTSPSRRSLGLASLSLGLAVASVPIMVQPAVAVAAVYLALARAWRSRAGRGLGVAFAFPGAAVVAATYAGILGQLGRQRLYFGAPQWPESLHSLASLLAYEWSIPDEPFGVARNEIATSAWSLAAASLLVITLVNVGVAARLVREPRRRSAALPGLALALVVTLLLMEHSGFGLPLPKGRTWLAIVPLFLLASFVASDTLVGRLRGRAEKVMGAAAAGACLVGLFLAYRGFDLTAYREWPEDAPLREVVSILPSSHKAGARVSLEFPWWMLYPLLYYNQREGGGALELRSKFPDLDVDADYMLAHGAAARQRYASQQLVRDYPRSGITLYRRERASNGHPTAESNSARRP